MPAVGACQRAGEIAREAGEHRSWNMSAAILLTSPRFVVQIVTAIDHDPGRIVELFSQCVGGNQRRVHGTLAYRVPMVLPLHSRSARCNS